MTRPLLLDLFCGAGGAAVGYHRAGFDVVGVDIKPQKRYPFRFVQADSLRIPFDFSSFAAVHASPPCQGYSRMRHLPWLKGRVYPMLIGECRAMLESSGIPWVMENVEDAPLGGIVLCGAMFGLKVYRHRRFESSHCLLQPSHEKHKETIGKGRMLNDRAQPNENGFVSLPSKVKLFAGRLPSRDSSGSSKPDRLNRNYHAKEGEFLSVAGHNFKLSLASKAMGIDWMNRKELAESIPPAYTEYIGKQLIRILEASKS